MSFNDSRLAKNIRPMSLIFLFAFFAVLALLDGNLAIYGVIFAVKPAYVAAFQSFTEYFVMFYAGGRSLEKIASVVSTMKAKATTSTTSE